ncbi:MAG: hypothetical protein SFU27_10100 [Thermonemataceae bacterium]|nr:hypothetical protein [Thermonemataceae bacterium]
MFSKKIFAVIASLALLASCGEKPKEEAPKGDSSKVEKNTETNKNDVTANVKDAVKQLPRVEELPDLLASAGVDDFYENLINPSKNVDKYMTTNDLAAINLGIYAVDLGYVLNYEKVQLGIDYVQVTQKLADKIGVSAGLDEKAMERFRKNMDKKDTLIKMSNEAVQNIDKYLRDNERVTMSALVLGGMFIEGLYLSTNIIALPSDYDKNLKNQIFGRMIKIIADQEKSLDDAIASLEAVKKDPKGDELLVALKEVKKIYTENKYSEKFAKSQSGKVPVSADDLKPLQDKIKTVRQSLTK